MKTMTDEPKTAHTGGHCHAQANTVTVNIDVIGVLDRLVNSLGLSRSAILEQLVQSMERRAIDVAETLPNGQACYLACELKFSASQQHSILNGVIPDQTIGE